MTWAVVARKDFRDAVRSHWLWVLSALFVAVLALPPALIVADLVAVQSGANDVFTEFYVRVLMDDTMTFLVPVIAVVLAYASVTGERDSGTLKLLLSLPHSRRDVVVGKAVGRGTVIVLPVLAGFVVTALVFLATPISLSPGPFVAFALLSALVGVVFVGIAVGVSAGTRSSRASMIGAVGVYVLFTLFWNQFVRGVIRLLSDYAGLSGAPRVKLHLFLKVLNPSQAYKTLVARVFADSAVAARVSLIGGLQRLQYGQLLGDSVPFYLSDPFVGLVLLAWLVAAPAAGYYAFREADL
ncbi:MAG: ABC transporter permease [Halobacteriales archaeon]